jgi:hypothetical protein
LGKVGENKMEKIKKFKWWWGWNSQEIENWLEKMALSGYRLTDVTSIGVFFSFEKAQCKKTRYCIDYQQEIGPSYIENLTDNGWEIIKMGSGWYICCKEYEGDRPDLFTDFDTLISRNNKLMFVIISSGLPFFLISPFILMFIGISIIRLVIAILWILVFIFDSFVIISLRKANKAILKKENLKS